SISSQTNHAALEDVLSTAHMHFVEVLVEGCVPVTMINHHKITITAVHPTSVNYCAAICCEKLRTRTCAKIDAVVSWTKIVSGQVMHRGRPDKETITKHAHRVKQACSRSIPATHEPPFSITCYSRI